MSIGILNHSYEYKGDLRQFENHWLVYALRHSFIYRLCGVSECSSCTDRVRGIPKASVLVFSLVLRQDLFTAEYITLVGCRASGDSIVSASQPYMG